MKKIFKYSLILGLLTGASCSDHPETGKTASPAAYDQIKKADWLIGSWQGSSPEGSFSERWTQLNDSVFSGKGFFIAGKDTVSAESLRLLQEGHQLFYEPTVRDQNEGKAVRFTMTRMGDNSMVFENPAHDFPQKVTYTRIGEDSLVAMISGLIEGKERSEVFPMKRMK